MRSWCITSSCGYQLDTVSTKEDMLRTSPQCADVRDLNIGDSIYALVLPFDPNPGGWRWLSFREAYSTTYHRETGLILHSSFCSFHTWAPSTSHFIPHTSHFMTSASQKDILARQDGLQPVRKKHEPASKRSQPTRKRLQLAKKRLQPPRKRLQPASKRITPTRNKLRPARKQFGQPRKTTGGGYRMHTVLPAVLHFTHCTSHLTPHTTHFTPPTPRLSPGLGGEKLRNIAFFLNLD